MNLKTADTNESLPVIYLSDIDDENLEINESSSEDSDDDSVEIIGHSHSYTKNDQPLKGHIEVVLIPGAGEVEDIKVDDDDENSSSDKKTKKDDGWNWESKGHESFIDWVKNKLDCIPKHSGQDTAGLERAISYLERIDAEISKAMRIDFNGQMDANIIESIRKEIDNGLERLEDRLEKIKKNKKRVKKSEIENDNEIIVKEAQKITGVRGVYVTVPLLVSRIARTCINGMVSAGHDIEDLFNKQAKYYNLNNREKAEVMQLLSDFGYPLRQDRGFLPEDSLEVTDDGMDWAANYHS